MRERQGAERRWREGEGDRVKERKSELIHPSASPN